MSDEGMHNRTIQNQRDSLDVTGSEDAAHTLQLLRAGSFQFGIFADDIAAIVAWREPTPLPRAPKPVLGVVSVQGRMLTVLDLATLTGRDLGSRDVRARHLIALRGDERLALAIETVGEAIQIGDAILESAQESGEGLVFGVFNHDGAEISILNVKELFSTAIQGRERRRRRF